MEKAETVTSSRGMTGNRFDRLEWAGAFGDLGTLIPFVVAYITLLKVDPYGILLAFGVAKIASGLYYRTPFPVQPMKAIGAVATTQAAQTIVITPQAVYGAGLVTGAIWFVLGITGTAKKVAELVSRPVAIGIVMGLGFGFMLEGIRMMAQQWVVGAVTLITTMVLLTNRAIPVMFLILLSGAAVAVVQDPALLSQLGSISCRVSGAGHCHRRCGLGGIRDRHFVLGLAAGSAYARKRGDRHHRREQPAVSGSACHGEKSRHFDRHHESSRLAHRRDADVPRRRRHGGAREVRGADGRAGRSSSSA